MADTRITSTNTGQYDQIFALPQGLLNQSLAKLFESSPELHNFETHNILGKISGALVGPPEVDLDVTSGAGFAKFFINFLDGKLILRDIDSGYVTKGSCFSTSPNTWTVTTSQVCQMVGGL